MRILEFHFNISGQKNNRFPDKISRCFSFLPKNIYERRVGGIFIVGEILNLLPQNIRLLEKMALAIKQSYFGSPLKSVDKSFTECLKTANNFLSQELKSDNVSWLGNLHCGIAAIKDRSFSYAKIGDIRAFLLRDGQITPVTNDKDKTAVRQTRSFNDIIYGNLDNFDRLLIMSGGAEKIFRFAPKSKLQKKENFKNLSVKSKSPNNQTTLMQSIAQTMQIEIKQLKTALSEAEGVYPQISGSCLAIEISDTFKENEPQVFQIDKASDWFSFKFLAFSFNEVRRFLILIFFFIKRIMAATVNYLKTRILPAISPRLTDGKRFINNLFKSLVVRLNLSIIFRDLSARLKISNKGETGLPKQLADYPPSDKTNGINAIFPPASAVKTIKIPNIIGRLSVIIGRIANIRQRKLKLHDNFYLVLLFFVVLFLGFIFFRVTGILRTNRQPSIEAVNRLVMKADELIIDGYRTDAISVLRQALSDAGKIKADIRASDNQRLLVTSGIDKRLKDLYNLTTVNHPEIFHIFPSADFIPQKIVLAGSYLYVYSPLSPFIYPLELFNGEAQMALDLPGESWQISSATDIFRKAAFFVKPNRLWLTSGGQMIPITLDVSAAKDISLNNDYDLNSISSFNGNLYFFENNYRLIVKYPYQGSDSWGGSQVWAKTKNPIPEYPGAGFLSVNGNAWLLNSGNAITVFRSASQMDLFNIDVYPPPKSIYKVISLDGRQYAYLLEPLLKRMIIVDTNGRAIKQYEFPAFDNLKDFAISSGGSKAYFLNSSTVYQVDIGEAY